ncbi:MAG: DUF5686 and carboxypeptidase regulatory-like domain-containing protein [Dysgonamonadaceae bacterium]|jgi:hypothetical protein|nr:DUF5686 and carboxypeptidase regulatory-like domain-containing protein [Dysgonamonadaceae bacterium]
MKQFRLLFFFFCLAIFPVSLNAQLLQGIVQNEKGEPVPNASIYISEIAQGIVANDKGQFQTNIKQGSYTCEFRSLGYEPKTLKIEVPLAQGILSVTLTDKVYRLDEVIVSSDGEDPAYRIMRKVIAYAPFYRNQVSEYRSQTYTKGSFHIDKIPGVIKRMSKMNGQKVDFNLLIGKTFVMESDNEIAFKAPNSYDQRVKAVKSSIPKEFDMGEEALKVVNSNIYDENIFKPGAFRYYKFKWEDVETNGGRTINKIKVIPRYKNGDLYSGYLYILEDTWNVFEADLTSRQMGTIIHNRVTFHEVKPSVYLPTTYDMNVNVNTMGVKGGGRYFVSITYQSVNVKQDKMPSSTGEISSFAENNAPSSISEKRKQKEDKTLKKMEKLFEKEELSTREAYQLSQMMQSVSETEEEKNKNKSLEIKYLENVEIKIDSSAFSLDSLYWAKIRMLPLEQSEARSYAVADSINPPDSIHGLSTGSRAITLELEAGPKSTGGKLLMGGGFKLGEKSLLRFDGIAHALNEYNFVDGFSLGQSLQYRLNLDSNCFLKIKPDVRYVTTRQTLRWKTEVQWHYQPFRQGYASLSFGHTAEDINRLYGMNRFLNSITAAAYGGNYIRFYDRVFFHATNRIDIANGLNLTTAFLYEKRATLQNLTSYNLFGEKVGPNMPDDWVSAFPNHRASILDIGLSYTPFYRYWINRGRKSYVTSNYPTFALRYKKGFGLPDNAVTSRFVLMEYSVKQSIKTSIFSRFRYAVGGGKFLNASSLQLPDYNYFRQNPMLVGDQPFNFSFNMLSEYSYSKDYWAEVHASYHSEYLLLKKLPFLQGKIFDEALHIHYLHTDGRRNCFEGGYSVGLGSFGRMGVFTAIDGADFKGVSIRISLPLFSILEM